MKRTAFILLILIFISGCASTGNKTREATQTQKDLGAALVITGMATGAYAGSGLINEEGGTQLISSTLGGLLAGGVTGFIYWMILQAVNSGGQGETKEIKENEEILMPVE